MPWGPQGSPEGTQGAPGEPLGGLRGRRGAPKGPSGRAFGPPRGCLGRQTETQKLKLSRKSPGLGHFLRKYSVFHITQNRYPRSSNEARGGPGEVLGSPWGPLGGPWGSLRGSLGVIGAGLGALGGPWGTLGIPKGVSVSLWEVFLELLGQRKIIEKP